MHRIFYLLFIAFFITQIAAYADTIQGTITKIDLENSLMNIHETNDAQNASQDVVVQISKDTVISNHYTLSDLQVNQDVKIEAKKNADTGAYLANMIELNKSLVDQPGGSGSEKSTEDTDQNY